MYPLGSPVLRPLAGVVSEMHRHTFATREDTSSDFGHRSQTTLLRHLENEYRVVAGRAFVRQRSARSRSPVVARPECFLRNSDSAARYLYSLAPPWAYVDSPG